MRFLLVDASPESRRTLSDMLYARWPDAQVEQWDPSVRGNPAALLARERYSAVLLEAAPAGEDGIAWVRQIRANPAAPPV